VAVEQDSLMDILGSLHGAVVHPRRIRVLASRIAALIPSNASVLDVGSGNGALAGQIGRDRPDVKISGIDVLRWTHTHIDVRQFDGVTVPFADRSVDLVMLVDVLHHTEDPTVLLREARRVARSAVVIKDHTRDGVLAGPTLRLMDWVGNARHGVALPYNYWTTRQWHEALGDLGFVVIRWISDLRLYPRPGHWLFDRSLHFIAVLAVP
jgi:SAM-dependent methyltransferase